MVDSASITVYVRWIGMTELYWPVESVTAERTFSISAGLDASTVTPGITAPVVSLTRPAMLLPLCARPAAGTSRSVARTPTHNDKVLRTRTSSKVRLKADTTGTTPTGTTPGGTTPATAPRCSRVRPRRVPGRVRRP